MSSQLDSAGSAGGSSNAIVAVSPRPNAKSTIKLSGPSLPAAQWLNGKWPLATEHLKEACEGHVFSMLLAVIESPDAVEAAQYLIKNSQEMIRAGCTRLQWLKDLSTAVCSQFVSTNSGAPDPGIDFRNRLSQILALKFGDPFLRIKTQGGSEKRLNTLHFGSLFAHNCRLEYDDAVGCFYYYNDKAGCWQPISVERCRRILVEFIVPFMHWKPAIYNGTPMFQQTILEQAKATNLHEPFKTDGYMFATLNKTLFLDTSAQGQAIRLHETDNHWGYKLRNAIPIKYNSSNTGCTKFREMLKNIMHPEDIGLFQYWCGLAVLGQNPLHKMMIIPGEAKSGKSTLAGVVERVVGEANVATLTTQRLEDRFELSEFFGKTLLVGKDVSDDFLSCKGAPMLKSLTGDTNLKAEVKYVQARVRLGSPFNVLIVSNHHLYVRVNDDIGAWKRRLFVIPVKKQKEFSEDAKFVDKLIESEGGGILYWMLEGAREVLSDIKTNNRRKLTDRQDANVMALLAKQDELADFTAACLRAKSGHEEASGDIYDAYCQYCGAKDLEAIAESVFYRRIGRYILTIKGAAGPKTIPGNGTLKAYKAYTGVEIFKAATPAAAGAASDDSTAGQNEAE